MKKATWIKVLQIWGLIVALMAVTFITIPFGNFQRSNGMVLATFFLNGIVWLVLLLNEIRKHPFSFQYIHWCFCLLFFFYAAMVQYTHNDFPWIGYRNDDILIKANIYLFIWTICIQIGIFLSKGGKSKGDNRFIKEWIGFEKLLPPLTVFTIVNTLWRIVTVGVVNLMARATSSVSYSDSSSISLLLNHSLRALSFFAAAIAILAYINKKAKIKWVICNFICLFISYSPTGMARFTAAAIYLGLLLIASKKLKSTRVFPLVFMLAFLIGLPFLNAFRNSAFGEVSILETLNRIIQGMPDEWLAGDYDAYAMFTLSIDYVEAFGSTLGKQFLGVLLFWVPRTIWPSKPVGSGYHMADTLGWSFKNLSCPLPGEGFINGGLIGLMIFAVIIGYAMSKLDRAYWQTIDIKGVKIRPYDSIYPAVITIFFFMCRGDLLSSTSYTMAFIAVWVLLSIIPLQKLSQKRKQKGMSR